MLELRPNCELCDCDLPPEATNARICTYECTFCAGCVDDVLNNVCPICVVGFVPRPMRPLQARREGLSRIGRGTKPPPQLGHTLLRTSSTQPAQKVHS